MGGQFESPRAAVAAVFELFAPFVGVFGCTLLPDDGEMRLYQHPWFWAAIMFTMLFIGNLILW